MGVLVYILIIVFILVSSSNSKKKKAQSAGKTPQQAVRSLAFILRDAQMIHKPVARLHLGPFAAGLLRHETHVARGVLQHVLKDGLRGRFVLEHLELRLLRGGVGLHLAEVVARLCDLGPQRLKLLRGHLRRRNGVLLFGACRLETLLHGGKRLLGSCGHRRKLRLLACKALAL